MIAWIEDIASYMAFKKDIRRELKNPNSLMNKFKIKKNWLGNILYMQLDCTEQDFLSADYSYDRMLETKLAPVVEYLSSQLGWGNYLVPQISQFVDDDGETSLSFGVLFIFQGYSMSLTKGLLLSLLGLGVIGGSVWALCHYLV